MRQPLTTSTPPVSCLTHVPTVLADLRLTVVTPMFGGGAEAGKSDTDWPIRGPAIRGHLRFWWRACNARRFATSQEMYDEESRLWGAATKKGTKYGPGAIGVTVEIMNSGTESFCFHEEYDDWRIRGWHHGELSDPRNTQPRGPSYALFPFTGAEPRDDRDEVMPSKGREGVAFRLRLSLAPHTAVQADTERCVSAAQQALWAWITFGGVGARTRRGCGSLKIVANPDMDQAKLDLPDTLFHPGQPDVGSWLTDMLQDEQLVPTGESLPLVSSLSRVKLRTGNPATDPIRAWASAVNPMQEFRQGVGTGRNAGTGNVPGQSRWPEPGSLRQLRGFRTYHQVNRRPDYDRPHRVIKEADHRDFPRADLGLPIQFERLPGKPRLEGLAEGVQRLASAIILKPLWTGADNYVPVALLLNAPHVWHGDAPGIHLKHGDYTERINLTPMDNPEPHWPWPPDLPPCTRGRESVRDAFMDYLALDPELQWTKVL